MTKPVASAAHAGRDRPPTDESGNRGLAGSERVRSRHVEWVQDRLTDRDWQIMHAVNQLRAVSGEQLQRLFFSSLSSPRSRVASRNRALKRLVDWRVLTPLARRVGGAGRGSSGAVFALDSAGHRLITAQQLTAGSQTRVRRPGTPTDRTLKHILGVAELYVRLVDQSRALGFTVSEYRAEPECWWPNGLGGHLKPDAYAVLESGDVIDHWWIEHDEATESLPTVRDKLIAYLDFVRRGQLGPAGVVPRVLLSTVSEARREAIEGLVSRLPPPADHLFAVAVHDRAVPYIVAVLRE